MNVEPNLEPVEAKIIKFIEEKFNKSRKEVEAMTIQNRMGLINMKYPDKWYEFKLGLRKVGYII